MKKDPLYKLLKKKDSIGLLCNQSAWHTYSGRYTFQEIAATGKLKTVFIPEHGLFGECQDQVKLDDTHYYHQLAENVEWVSLYQSDERSLSATPGQLSALDTIVIDIQDVGSRYYTYTATIWLLLQQITNAGLSTTIIILDKPNPAGRQVEGTRMTDSYASLIGITGLPHRHGLTLGELCTYFKEQLQGKWELIVVPPGKKDRLFIAPSPNIPTTTTCRIYSGQCLWEGTNVSEGRGTTQPFEITGAPFIDWLFTENFNDSDHPLYNKYCYVRPLYFIPVFHKFANEICRGWQLIVHEAGSYHSLSHSLQMIRYTREKSASFAWRPGQYEAMNTRKAIDLLAGDQVLLAYLEGEGDWNEVKDKMDEEETAWIEEVTPFLLYKSTLQKLKIK